MTSLGEPFLHAVYDGLLQRDSAFLVTARERGELRGFILASTDPQMLPVVIRAPHRFAWSLVSALVRRPGTIVRIVETLTYGRKTAGTTAELLAIAVQPEVRSRGIGRRLREALDEELAARDVRAYKVTVHRDMTDANRFYIQNGFALVRTFDLFGVAWNMYVRDLADDPDGAGSPVAVSPDSGGRS